MALGDVLRDVYRRAEDVFYSFLDWLDAHNVPIYRAVDWLEERNIPAFPVFLAALFLILSGIVLLTLPTAVPTRSVIITVKDAQGYPVKGARVILHAADGAELQATTDELGNAYFDDVPEGPYSYEVLDEKGRKLGEKDGVTTSIDTITLSPPEDESVKFCVQVVDAETGEVVFGAAVTAGSIEFTYTNGVYCAKVSRGSIVSVGADGYEGTQITAAEGYDEVHPYVVKLQKSSRSTKTTHTLSVTVLYDGSPISADVRVLQGGSVVRERTTPASTGTATFDLAPGTYTIVVFGKEEYSTLRAEKTIDLDSDKTLTIDLKEEGETIEPPADAPMQGEEGYKYSITINGSTDLKLRVGKNNAHVCVKTDDSSVDSVEITFEMNGKSVGGPAYVSPMPGEVACTDVTVSPKEEGTAQLFIKFFAGSTSVKDYSLNIPVQLTKFTAVLCVKGETGEKITSAHVKVGAQDDYTGSDGCVSFVLPPGEYDVHIEAQGYLPLDDKVNVSSNLTKTFTLSEDLEAKGYHCDGGVCYAVFYNGLPSSQLSNGVTASHPVNIKACVRGGEESYTVTVKNNDQILTSFTLVSGTSTQCESRSITPDAGTLTVEFEKGENVVYSDSVSVTAEMYTVTICAKDYQTYDPISGADVSVGDSSGTTGEDGCADIQVPAGKHTYKVSASGYLPASGTVAVYADITKTVYLQEGEEGKGKLKVCVYEEGSGKAIEGATVHVGDQEWETGSDGCVEDYVDTGSYEVWAEKDGYVESAQQEVKLLYEGAKKELKLYLRPDTPGSVVLTSITSGGQPVAVLVPGTYTLEFTVAVPARAKKAVFHVAVDDAQSILFLNGRKDVKVALASPGKTVTQRVTLTVSFVSEPITLPVYYHLEVSDGSGEYNIPEEGGKADLTIYPLSKPLPCSKSGVGITTFLRVDGEPSTYLQAGVDNEIIFLVATCRPDVSIDKLHAEIKLPNGKKNEQEFSGAPNNPYQPKEFVYKYKPDVKDVGAAVLVKAEAKKDTSVLAVAERSFTISYYEREICLSVSTTPSPPVPNESLLITVKPHLCQHESQLPKNFRSEDTKIQITGGSAIPPSEYGKTFSHTYTLAPASHGDIVLSCYSSYYTCRFDGGDDTYVLWVYKKGLLRFDSSTYNLPVIKGEIYNEIPLTLKNFTKYNVKITSAEYRCTNGKNWQFEVNPPSSVPGARAGEPGEADVLLSATWVGEGSPSGTPVCDVTVYGTYTLEGKEYAVSASTKVYVNQPDTGIKISLSESPIALKTGVWKSVDVTVELPENVPFSSPSLKAEKEPEASLQYRIEEIDTIGSPLKYKIWLRDDGKANYSTKLKLIFSAKLGVKEVSQEADLTVDVEYVPSPVTFNPALLSFTIWPNQTTTQNQAVEITNEGGVPITIRVEYDSDQPFFTLNVDGDLYTSLKPKKSHTLNVSVQPKKEKLKNEPLEKTTTVKVHYSFLSPSGTQGDTIEIPVTVRYVSPTCLKLSLMDSEIHKGEKTNLVLENDCGVDLKNVAIYEKLPTTANAGGGGGQETGEQTEKQVGVVNILAGQTFYVEVPTNEPSCDNQKYCYITYRAEVPSTGIKSGMVSLKYIPTTNPFKKAQLCTDSDCSEYDIPFAYDEPFTSDVENISCSVAFCGRKEFLTELLDKLAEGVERAYEHAAQYSTPDQIPGCSNKESWCKLPVYSFTLYAKEGVTVASWDALLKNLQLSEKVGTLAAAEGEIDTGSAKSGYVYVHGNGLDGCGRYTFVLTPYVRVTPGAVTDQLAFDLSVVKDDPNKVCKDEKVYLSHLHFDFASLERPKDEKGLACREDEVTGEVGELDSRIPPFLYITSNVYGDGDIINNVMDAINDIVGDSCPFKVLTQEEPSGGNPSIVIDYGGCTEEKESSPIAIITFDKTNKKLTFKLCEEKKSLLTPETIANLIKGWLSGPFTGYRFEGYLGNDGKTFYVYGVYRTAAGEVGKIKDVYIMPGVPAKIHIDTHELKVCPEGMTCTFKVTKITISCTAEDQTATINMDCTSGGSDCSFTVTSAESESVQISASPASNPESSKPETFTDTADLRIVLPPDQPYGDSCTITVHLQPTNIMGENVKEKLVIIDAKVVGLDWDDLASALLTPSCEYDTWEVCVFKEIVSRVKGEMGGEVSEVDVAKMLLGKDEVDGVPVEDLWNDEKKDVWKSVKNIEFNVWVRPNTAPKSDVCNHIHTIIPPESAYENYVVNVSIKKPEGGDTPCETEYGIYKQNELQRVIGSFHPAIAHTALCTGVSVICEAAKIGGTGGLSAWEAIKAIPKEIFGCALAPALSTMGVYMVGVPPRWSEESLRTYGGFALMGLGATALRHAGTIRSYARLEWLRSIPENITNNTSEKIIIKMLDKIRWVYKNGKRLPSLPGMGTTKITLNIKENSVIKALVEGEPNYIKVLKNISEGKYGDTLQQQLSGILAQESISLDNISRTKAQEIVAELIKKNETLRQELTGAANDIKRSLADVKTARRQFLKAIFCGALGQLAGTGAYIMDVHIEYRPRTVSVTLGIPTNNMVRVRIFEEGGIPKCEVS